METWKGRLYQWLFISEKRRYDALTAHLLAFPSNYPVYVLHQSESTLKWESSAGPITETSTNTDQPPEAPAGINYRSFAVGQQLRFYVAEEAWLAEFWSDITTTLPTSSSITRDLITTLQLESLIDLIHDAVLLETKDRKIAYVNIAFCQLFSIPLPPKKLVGLDCAAAMIEAKALFVDPDGFVDRIEALLEQPSEVRNDRLQMKSGKLLNRDYRPLRLHDVDFGRLWVYSDITEIVEQEKRFQQQERKYHRVLENLDVGIMEVDNDGIVTRAFSKFCDLVGYSEEELIGKNPLQVFDNPEMQEKLTEFNEHAKRRSGGESSVYELPLRRKDGHIIWIQISGTPIYNERLEIVGSLGLHFDITERKRRQDELQKAKNEAEAANRAKEKFMSNLSHEMLTPMNGIMGFLNRLQELPDLSEKQSYFLSAIQNAADNLLVLLEDLLDFSRIEGSEVKINKRVFNVERSINNFCSTFENQLKENNNTLTVEIDPKLPYKLSGDPLRLGQMIKHLTSNAIKFTENGKVSVRLKEESRTDQHVQVILEVEDTGTGIPEAEYDKIFDRFYRSERFTNRLTTGTGIGLSIVKQIAQQIGGTISVISEVGKGSIFRVHFPLAIADDQKISRLLDEHGKALSDFPVLVAEDNTINQMLIKEHLKNWKIPFTLVDNGEAVLKKLDEKPYQLILMDVQMPIMTGIEATKLIRKTPSPYQQIPIIALTAYVLTDDEQQCLEAGMNDHVSKPFNPFQLLSKIIELGLNKAVAYVADNNTQKQPITGALELQYLDLTKLNAFTNGNAAVQKKLVTMMVNQEKDILIDVQTFEAVKNWEGLFQLMHRLKPNVDLLGMVQVKPLVEDLTERFRHQQDLEDAPALLAQFQRDFKLAVNELKLLLT